MASLKAIRYAVCRGLQMAFQMWQSALTTCRLSLATHRCSGACQQAWQPFRLFHVL